MKPGVDAMLFHRDPMLAAAMAAHGADWRPDLHPLTQLRRDDRRRLPGVELRTLLHRLEWPDGDGRAVFQADWKQPYGSSHAGWVAKFHMGPLPETLGLAITGRTLDAVIDADGADAWRINGVLTVPELTSVLKLSRVDAQMIH